MFTCDFSKRGGMSLWEYLYAELKNAIRAGVFSAGEKMPSKRALASHLGVSVITISAAYSQLISEGWLSSIERKGFFAADVDAAFPHGHPRGERLPAGAQEAARKKTRGACATEKSAECWDRAKRTAKTKCAGTPECGGAGKAGNTRRAPNARTARTNSGETAFVDFRDNSTALEKFPFSRWSLIIRKILCRPTSALLARSGTAGLPELRGEISSYLLRFRNINVPPERIIVCPGTEYAYGMLVQILGRGKIYAVENPGYRKTADALRANGAVCRPIEMDAEGIRPDRAEAERVSVIHVSPSHHYPTGKVMPVKRRLELLAWSGANASAGTDDTGGRWIIEDDYDSEFRFAGKPLETLQSLSETSGDSRVIYINTFSKTLAPSFRISYMVLPEKLAGIYEEKVGFLSCAVPNLDQLALAEFMATGNFETHIIRMKNYYRTTRNNLISAIENSGLATIANIKEENAGLHFLLALDTRLSGEALRGKLRGAGINVALLSDYFHPGSPEEGRGENTAATPYAERTLVVNYSALGREKISEAVRRMEKALLPQHATV